MSAHEHLAWPLGHDERTKRLLAVHFDNASAYYYEHNDEAAGGIMFELVWNHLLPLDAVVKQFKALTKAACCFGGKKRPSNICY
jgi:hypothetical protein